MLFKHIDMEAALRRLAERRIEDAMKDGKFDNLPGAGRPIELDPVPLGENARANGWGRGTLRNNDFIPEEVRWRKTLDRLKAELHAADTEDRVVKLSRAIN